MSPTAPRLAIASEPAPERPFERPSPPPLAIDARALALALGMSERGVRKAHAAGRIPRPIRIGRAVRWRVAEIEAWLAAGAPARDKWEATR